MTRIQQIEISNILGTEHASFAPGTLTVITGRNGSGKSSLIDALTSVFDGGHNPALLRRGAKKGSILLTLDDGTQIAKAVTATRSEVVVTDPKGRPVSSPQTFIRGLAESLAVDPARLLAAKPKDLMAILLEVMPVSFEPAEILERIPAPVREHASIPKHPANLDELAAVRKQLYESRTAVNRSVRDAEGTVATLRGSLPDQDETDWAAEAERRGDELRNAEAQVAEWKKEAEDALAAAEREIAEDIERRMRELHEEKERRIAAARAERDQALQRLAEQTGPAIKHITEQAAKAREKAQAQAKAAGVRQSIEQFEERARHGQVISGLLSQAIQSLDELRQQKLDALPVPGLEVADGKVLVDGVQWEHVNTARQVEIAFAVSALRAGRLPFMVVDDAEHFDAETWEAFREGALASGFQVVAARVSDGPLQIEAVEDAAA